MVEFLSRVDQAILANYQFKGEELACSHQNRKENDWLLAVDTSNAKHLTTIRRKDITPFEISLKALGDTHA